jgi:hypothetical protein
MLGAFPGAIAAMNSPRIFRADDRPTTLDMPRPVRGPDRRRLILRAVDQAPRTVLT